MKLNELKTTRRSVFGALFGGVAAAAVGPTRVAQEVMGVTAAVVPGAIPASPVLPLFDVLKKIHPFGELKMITDKVYHVEGYREGLHHVDSTIYGKDLLDSLLSDPIGKKEFMSNLFSGQYGTHDMLPDLDKVSGVLLADGNITKARTVRSVQRAKKVFDAVQTARQRAEMALGCAPPPAIYRQESRDERWKRAQFEDLPKLYMEKARKEKKIAAIIDSAVLNRNKKDPWLKACRKWYSHARDRILFENHWKERDWERDMRIFTLRRARWTVNYKLRRRKYLQGELDSRLQIKQVVLNALVEHQLAGRAEDVDTCLGVIKRLDAWIKVSREGLEMPPKIDPVEVSEKALYDAMMEATGWRERAKEVDDSREKLRELEKQLDALVKKVEAV